jgi:hypothetical protein
MARIVKVTEPKVTGLKDGKQVISKKSASDPWNPPELVGKSKGEVHDFFEHLGCKAAREGKKALKDAHGAWLHGWTMEMENTGKLEHLKVEDPNTEPFLFRKRNKQEMADYDEGFKAGSDSKGSDEDKSFAWQRGWAEAQE